MHMHARTPWTHQLVSAQNTRHMYLCTHTFTHTISIHHEHIILLTHTHAHTPYGIHTCTHTLPCYILSIKDIGQDLTECWHSGFGRWVLSTCLCLVPVLSSLVSQLDLCSGSRAIITMFHLASFSFLLACISTPASECSALAFFAIDQTTVASSVSVGFLLTIPQFPLGCLCFSTYARGWLLLCPGDISSERLPTSWCLSWSLTRSACHTVEATSLV